MRLFTCIIALALSVMTVNAKPISREQAKVRAASFMKLKGDVRKLSDVINQKRLAPGKASAAASKDMAPYYVFDRGTNEGFIIVSGDDQTVDVLGYCDNGSFDYSHLPINLQEWLDEYASQIVRIQRGAPVLKAASHPKVDQLMSSKWSQGSPYNLACPLDGGSRSVTGCVATAMAQILYYNREKMVTETQAAMPSYSTWTKGINVPGIAAGAPIDWDNMKDTYGSANDLQRTAVANLMLYCGVGAKMDYTSSSSGAQSSDAHQAFVNYFGCSQARFVTYADVSTDEEWDRIVYQEMAAGRPVYLSGSNATVGHAFVADGYDGTRYHINWGWGGQSDGYYYLTNLTPGDGQGIGGSSDGYNGWKQIVVNIEPDNYMEKKMSFSDSQVGTLCLANFDSDGDGKLTYGEVAAVTSLGSVFKGAGIKTFSELYYFTSLTELPDDAFNGCTALTSLRLPKSLKKVGARAFKDCAQLRQINLPTSVNSIGEEAFSGCKMLSGFAFPDEIETVGDGTFRNCAVLSSINLPISVSSIGSEAFAGCTRLSSFTINTFHPSDLNMGSSIFSDVDLSAAKLYIKQGTKSFFANDAQWKQFGTIIEVRERSAGQFDAIEPNGIYYLYNLGTGRYLTKGEAYGTQAIVGTEPLRFKANHGSAMAEGVYYFTNLDASNTSKNLLFRTSTDGNVGKGVKAMFVDGQTLTAATCHWKVEEVADKIYTIHVPSTVTASYVEGQYMGVQTDHQSGAASPTYGVYYDVEYSTHKLGCQWQLVRYDEAKAQNYAAADRLGRLLSTAEKRNIKKEEEQAVYDNLESTTEQLLAAQSSLRKKLNFIDFKETVIRDKCISLYDSDSDGELSMKEASEVSDLGYLFYFSNNTDIKTFDEFQYFSNIGEIYGNTFDGCVNLESVVIPKNVEKIYYNAFQNCKKLTTINLPEFIELIGQNTFDGCTALREVTVMNADPATINLGDNVFKNVPLAQCTLRVPFGSKERYAAANVWKNFGNIVEMRGSTQPKFSQVETNATGYLYNIGMRKMITMGEAYGTQSVVGRTGRVYQMKHSSNMGENVFCLQDVESERYVFRTTTDSKVGEGTKACFGDGKSLTTSAYWKMVQQENGYYTIQLPENDADYQPNQYLGASSACKSDFTDPSNGIYWSFGEVSNATLWAFISEDDMKAAQAMDELAARLAKMLNLAKEQQIDATAEQAVYDNAKSTPEDIRAAIRSIREKMHLITFNDENAESISISNWDENGDGELSFEEAAAVTDIGEIFRGATSMKNFEELRYFTGLTSIPDNAFRSSSSLNAICLPASVKSIGMYAFTGCSVLRYLVLLNDNDLIAFGSCGLPKMATTIFVKPNMIASYEADEQWKSSAKAITEYTGKPVVTATGTRIYGRSNATIEMKVLGAPVFGTAETSCDVTNIATTPVGTYPISVQPGTITTTGVEYREGEFIITQAPLTITAKSYTRNVGEPNPEFELTYKSFRNRETDTVFTVRPVITCEATPESPAGEYEIVVSGAEAHNYAITYVNGTLTVVNPAGIKDLTTDGKDNEPVFDLQGRKVLQPKRGVYVTNKRKVIVK